MPRPKSSLPAYSHHKPSGQAFVRIPDGAGGKRYIYLGRYGSAESKEAYRRQLAELEAREATAAIIAPLDDPTVSQLFCVFIKHAEQHYRRPDGTKTPELTEYKALSRFVRRLYGRSPAREFGPLAVKAVREAMIGQGWCRSLVNQRIGRLKRAFKWAASEQLVPVTVYQAIATVAGLQRGRTEARESEPIEPVDDAVVDATLPFLNRHVRGLVEFQRHTGCRPGEAVLVRRADIDTGGTIWLYRPLQHKTAWRGKARVIAIGPKAQEVLKEFLTPNLNDYLFSPAGARAERFIAMRAERKSPVQPSQICRQKPRPKKRPGIRYTSRSYAAAIATAAEKAKVAHWHPNQLRHSYATRVRKEHGLEAAQVLLGHARADVTQVYAERNLDLALTVAAKIG